MVEEDASRGMQVGCCCFLLIYGQKGYLVGPVGPTGSHWRACPRDSVPPGGDLGGNLWTSVGPSGNRVGSQRCGQRGHQWEHARQWVEARSASGSGGMHTRHASGRGGKGACPPWSMLPPTGGSSGSRWVTVGETCRWVCPPATVSPTETHWRPLGGPLRPTGAHLAPRLVGPCDG